MSRRRTSGAPSEGRGVWMSRAGMARGLKWGLIAAVLVLPAAWGIGKWLEPGRFPVRHVDVSGDGQRVDLEWVRQVTLPHVSDGLLYTDVHRLGRALRAVDWVDQVTVRRMWPDQVQLTLTEHRPVARWGDDAWLNDRGEVFRAHASHGDQGLPRFRAPERYGKDLLRRYRPVRDRLDRARLRIVSVDVDGRLAWRLALRNGVGLKLGRKDLERRAQRFTRAWARLLAPHAERIQEVDLRYPHGLAVVWRRTGGAARVAPETVGG